MLSCHYKQCSVAINTFLKCYKRMRLHAHHIITTHKQSLQRLCFHRCLSVHRGVCIPACNGVETSWACTPPRQVHLLAGIPPSRYTPCTVHAGIQSTSKQYASHWNAFLFNDSKYMYHISMTLFPN